MPIWAGREGADADIRCRKYVRVSARSTTRSGVVYPPRAFGQDLRLHAGAPRTIGRTRGEAIEAVEA
jgi:hypothetical protein